MATSLPRVSVTRAADGAFDINCTCGDHYRRITRLGADLTAADHRAGHARPDRT